MRGYGVLVSSQLMPGVELSPEVMIEVAEEMRRTGLMGCIPVGEILLTADCRTIYGWFDDAAGQQEEARRSSSDE